MKPEKINVIYRKIDSIKPWPGNPRRHDDGAIDRSVGKFGPRQPVMVLFGIGCIIQ